MLTRRPPADPGRGDRLLPPKSRIRHQRRPSVSPRSPLLAQPIQKKYSLPRLTQPANRKQETPRRPRCAAVHLVHRERRVPIRPREDRSRTGWRAHDRHCHCRPQHCDHLRCFRSGRSFVLLGGGNGTRGTWSNRRTLSSSRHRKSQGQSSRGILPPPQDATGPSSAPALPPWRPKY